MNYRSMRHEISCDLSSKLSSKNHGNKGQNSRISLALLLHNTVDSGKCFGFWEVFWILENVLDSGRCFWILGSVLDSEGCFWILGSVLDSGKCFGS